MDQIKYQQIKDTYFSLNKNVTSLDILLKFEQVLESMGLYGYKNWEAGEVLHGPDIKKHWIVVQLMYDADEMPDPDGGLRLENAGCKVFFEKSTLLKPVRVLSTDSYEDPRTKRARKEELPVWVITIKMPRTLVDSDVDASAIADEDDYANNASAVTDDPSSVQDKARNDI